MTYFDGPVEQEEVPRLEHQHVVIRQLMIDGKWRTLGQIEENTGYPQASISAQLRHLRKERFGSWIVNKRRVRDDKSGLWEYQLLPPLQRQKSFWTA